MANYYQSNNNQQAKENARKAKEVLNRTWRDKIHDGQFYVYTYANQDGEKAIGANNVQVILQTLVLSKFRYVQDFTKGLTESQLKLNQAKQIARYGMGDIEINGLIKGCQNSVLGTVWGRKEYWLVPELQGAAMVVIKKSVDNLISDSFAKQGQISIGEIYDFLQQEYGFSPCNLSAFITGFLLKEYSSDPYRCINAEGYPEVMTPDKLAEMIGNYIGKNPKTTYIVKMTPNEKAFYEVTEEAWGVPATSCSSPTQVSNLVSNKMRELGYPIWCLEEVDSGSVYDVVKKYIALVQSEGKATHNIAIAIGEIAQNRPSVAKYLKELLTEEKCKAGMESFLGHFEDGRLISLASEIGDPDILLPDIKRIFSIKHSALWIKETGCSEIQKLIVEYEVIKQTNTLLNVHCNSKEKMFNAWRDELKFVSFSCEALKSKRPNLDKTLSYLQKIAFREDFLPEMMKGFWDELVNNMAEVQSILRDKLSVFVELYGVYLEGFNELEKEEIRSSIKNDLFTTTATVSNSYVKAAAETYRSSQKKTQLFNAWKERTGTKNPREWSSRYQTPILSLVDDNHYDEAKRAFATLNNHVQGDIEITEAITFVENSGAFFEKIKDEEYRNKRFFEKIIGEYSALLNINAVRSALENLTIDAYEWLDSPVVRKKIQDMAQMEYDAGGSDKAVALIDEMSDAELKLRLKELVKRDIQLGVRIIENGGK